MGGGGYNIHTRMKISIQSTCHALLAVLCLPLAAQEKPAAAVAADTPAEEQVEDVVDASAISDEVVLDAEEVQPGAPPLSPERREEMENTCRDFLKASSDMWYLLANVRSKKDADAAADRVTELVTKIYELDEKLSAFTMVATDAACAGMLDSMQVRILDSLETVNEEFLSLRRIRCYGSKNLVRAFRLAAKVGLFAEGDVDELTMLPEPYTAEAAATELQRLQKLIAPDQEIHLLLVTVMDSRSANTALPRLARLDETLRGLEPKLPRGVFADENSSDVRGVTEPLVGVLWNIRNELVRIAGLPGYAGEQFDDFSDQLDKVFDTLQATHSVWFEDVFDASFRTDLDDAFHDNLKSQTH